MPYQLGREPFTSRCTGPSRAPGLFRNCVPLLLTPLCALAFAPDGRALASGGMWDHIELWEVTTGKVRTIPGTGQTFAQGVSFSCDGRTLISTRQPHLIQLWNIAELRELARLTMDSDVRCLASSRDGRFVACGDADSRVRVWDLAPSLGGPGRRVQEERPGPLTRGGLGTPSTIKSWAGQSHEGALDRSRGGAMAAPGSRWPD